MASKRALSCSASRASARSSRETTWLGSSREHAPLIDGDVVVVTQKIVSKAEGRTVADRLGGPGAKRPLPSQRRSVSCGAGAIWW